jgi:hypothetical protein
MGQIPGIPEKEFPINQDLHNMVAFDTCVENMLGTVMKALAASNPRVDHVMTRGPDIC